MKIEIAKTDLWEIRELIRDAIWAKENVKDPSVYRKMTIAARKAYKSIVRAQVKAFGHDWSADKSYFPNNNIKQVEDSWKGQDA